MVVKYAKGCLPFAFVARTQTGALFRRIICLSINRVGVIGVYENRETRRRENDVFSQFKTTLRSKNNFFFFEKRKNAEFIFDQVPAVCGTPVAVRFFARRDDRKPS